MCFVKRFSENFSRKITESRLFSGGNPFLRLKFLPALVAAGVFIPEDAILRTRTKRLGLSDFIGYILNLFRGNEHKTPFLLVLSGLCVKGGTQTCV